MKGALDSTTVKTFGAVCLGAILTLAFHYAGLSEQGNEVLVGAWTALATGLWGIFQRYRTSTPMKPLRRPPGGPTTIVSLLGVGLLVLVTIGTVGAVCGAVLGGCGAMTHNLEPGAQPGMELRLGPPAYGAMTEDGEPVCTMTHPTKAFDLSPDAATCELLCGDGGAP
jgi:hypothetical protein